jgi:hypothetical protein
MTPVSVFLTFESEEGYNRALKCQDNDIYWKDQQLSFSPAPEPTDIIWENRQFSTKKRVLRACYAILIILILLAISFVIIVTLKQKQIENNLKYADADCQEIDKIYSYEHLRDYSIDQWHDHYQAGRSKSQDSKVSGVLTCFCNKELGTVGYKDLSFTSYSDGELEAYVCHEWLYDKLSNKIYGQLVSISINIVNIVIKLILISLIKHIGEDTKS